MTEAVTITPGARVSNGRQVPEVGTWEIDASHASFEFVARHLMAKVRGRFPVVSGEAHIAEVPEESSLEVEIDASTIDTKDTDRDAHLRSSDFFRVEDHPTISFRSTAVRPGEGESKWKIDGDLTIKGVTRPVTVDVEFLGGRHRPLGQPAHRLLGRGGRGQPGGLGPDLEHPPGDGRVPAVQVGPPALLRLVSSRHGEVAIRFRRQIAKASSSNATATRKVTGASTASS
jgi:polyisoprenoid-binding protein YceI